MMGSLSSSSIRFTYHQCGKACHALRPAYRQGDFSPSRNHHTGSIQNGLCYRPFYGLSRIAAISEPDGVEWYSSLSETRFDMNDSNMGLLTVQADEILVPGMEKTLDLPEGYYMDLLEMASIRKDKLLTHSVITSPWEEHEADIYPSAGAFLGVEFALSCNTIVQILNVVPHEHGAFVTIRGVARAKINNLTSTYPCMSGDVELLMDDEPADKFAVLKKSAKLKSCVEDVLRIGEKMQAMHTECIRLCAALKWATSSASQVLLTSSHNLKVQEAARISFAVLQDFPQACVTEEFRIIRARMNAMATTNTEDRLDIALRALQDARAMLAAKASLHHISNDDE